MAGPPSTGTFLSFPCLKDATQRPSGDMNGRLLPVALIAQAGAGHHLHLGPVEGAAEHLLPPVHHGGDEELPAIGTEPHDRGIGGQYSGTQLRIEPHRSIRTRPFGAGAEPSPQNRSQERCASGPRRGPTPCRMTAHSHRRPGTADRLGEFGGGLRAVGGQLLQRGGDGLVDVRGDRFPLEPQGPGLVRHDRRYDGLRRSSGERRLAGQHFVQHHPERVHIGPGIDVVLARGLLRTHVLRRADADAGLGQPDSAFADAPDKRYAEVGDQSAAVVEQNVVRLDVAMDHAAPVGILQPGGDFSRDPDRLRHRQLGFALEPGAERLTLHVGHDVEDRVQDLARIEQRKDVGMLEIGGSLDLLQEAAGSKEGREVRVHDLDGDFAVVARVEGEVHRCHSPGAEHALEDVSVGECGLEAVERVTHELAEDCLGRDSLICINRRTGGEAAPVIERKTGQRSARGSSFPSAEFRTRYWRPPRHSHTPCFRERLVPSGRSSIRSAVHR